MTSFAGWLLSYLRPFQVVSSAKLWAYSTFCSFVAVGTTSGGKILSSLSLLRALLSCFCFFGNIANFDRHTSVLDLAPSCSCWELQAASKGRSLFSLFLQLYPPQEPNPRNKTLDDYGWSMISQGILVPRRVALQ